MNILKYIFPNRYDRVTGMARPSNWSDITRAFAKFVPKQCPFDGLTKVQLHHSRVPYHQDPSQGENPNQLRWACEGVGTHNHHLWFGHNGFFQSLCFCFDQRIEEVQNRKIWNGKEWVPEGKPPIKYRLSEADIPEWNKIFGTNWKYEP